MNNKDEYKNYIIKCNAKNGAKAISIAVDGNWAYILFEK